MQSKYTPKQIERFWGNVDKSGGDNSCWPWMGYCEQKGYGQIRIGDKIRKAHRVAYELSSGEIPENLFVCHSCDNRPCCNPKHLWIGTHQDNMNDRNAKGRQGAPHEEGHGMHKLSVSQVLEIRQRYQRYKRNGDSSVTLAKEFGMSQSQIWNIVKNKQWV